MLISKNLYTFSPSSFTLYYPASIRRNPSSRFSLSIVSDCGKNFPHLQIPKHKLWNPLNLTSLGTRRFCLGVFESDGVVQRENSSGDFNFDSFLAIAELLSLVSVAVISLGFAVNYTLLNSKKTFLAVIGEKNLVWGLVLLVCGVAIGAWIRRRQWTQLHRQRVKGAFEANLVERIEKIEEGLRSSATLIQALSRQLEKLGIRFRVTRKALKDPIAETAALANKNSEATRALALQEEILEKELGEIQKVLLAMQEQQQKQLELILAIGKTGKLLEIRQDQNIKEKLIVEKHESADQSSKQKEAHHQL